MLDSLHCWESRILCLNGNMAITLRPCFDMMLFHGLVPGACAACIYSIMFQVLRGGMVCRTLESTS